MALATLTAAQDMAQEYLGMTPARVDELLTPKIHDLGLIRVAGRDYRAWRGHVGNEDWVGKGGIRISDELGVEVNGIPELVTELPAEMAGKLALWGLPYKGAKGIIEANPHKMTIDQRAKLLDGFARAMVKRGIAGHDKDVPAGDMGTNGLIDHYALAYKEEMPDDPHWRGAITGKSVLHGGLAFRPAATGYGVYRALKYEMDRIDPGDSVHSVKVQGFGNVGSHFAKFASDDPRLKVVAISDLGGTLHAPDGMTITDEIVEQIGDNPAHNGDKITDLLLALQKNDESIALMRYDDRESLNLAQADWYIPASIPDVINRETMQHINTRYGIIEAGNGVTTKDASDFLLDRDFIIIPDLAANGAGVACSIKELRVNTDPEMKELAREISAESVKKELASASDAVMDRLYKMASALDTKDLRAAAAVLQLAQLGYWQGERFGGDIDSMLVAA